MYPFARPRAWVAPVGADPGGGAGSDGDRCLVF